MMEQSRWQRALIASGFVNFLLLIAIGGLADYFPAAQDTPLEVEIIAHAGATSNIPSVVSPVSSLPQTPDAPTPAQQLQPALNTGEGQKNGDAAESAQSSTEVSTPIGAAAGAVTTNSGQATGVGPSTGMERKNILPPRILRKTEPVYPEQARRQGWEGTVRVKIEITAEGRASNVWVVSSSGYEILDNAAVQAVRQWRFVPAKDESSGSPVSCITSLSVAFRLNS
ncbi:energy transducer TonB [Thermosinus carboxydivorans]|nr:energy transducer TonB [Thermosinus carboxydivorans]